MDSARLPRDLLARCLDGNESAWVALRTWLANLFARLGRSIFNLTNAECDDAVQQTLLELLHNDCQTLRTFRGGCHPETYLIVIARRVAADIRKNRLTAIPLDGFEPASLVDDPDWQQIDFWEAANRLAPGDRLLLRMCAAGLSFSEIATMLAQARGDPVTASALAVRKHRALARLRAKLTA